MLGFARAAARPHRPLDPVRRFRPARRGDSRDRRGRRRLDPCRRHGRPFRPQHHHRPGGGEGAAAAHGQAVRRPSDDLAGRSLPAGLRRGRRRHPHRPSRGRPPSPPHDPAHQVAGQARRRLAQSRHARQGARLCAGGDRPRPGDERQSGLRRPELHREPAQEGRGDPQAHRRARQGDRPRGGRRRRSGQLPPHRSTPAPTSWSPAPPRSAAAPPLMPAISSVCAGKPVRAGRGRRRRAGDRAGQAADPGRGRSRPLAVRASQLPPASPRLAHAAAQAAPARPGAAAAAGGAEGSDRRRQGGGRDPAARHLSPRRDRSGGRGVRFRDRRPSGGLQRLSAKLRLAARPFRRGDARARRQAGGGPDPQVAGHVRRPGRRCRLAGRSVGAADPLLDRLRALHPVEPRPRLPLFPPPRSRPRRAPSRPQRRQGPARPAPDHGLGRRHRRRSGGAGRTGATEVGRGRAVAGADVLAARRWRTAQPLAGRAARSGRDAGPAAVGLYRQPARRSVLAGRDAGIVGQRLARGDPGRRRAVQLAGRQHGQPSPRPCRRRRLGRRCPPAAPCPRLGLPAAAGEDERAGVRRGAATAAARPQRRLRLDACLRVQRRRLSPDRQLRRCRRGPGRASGRARLRAPHHRRFLDPDARRPQLDRDPRGRLARQGRRRGRNVARRDRGHHAGRGQP